MGAVKTRLVSRFLFPQLPKYLLTHAKILQCRAEGSNTISTLLLLVNKLSEWKHTESVGLLFPRISLGCSEIFTGSLWLTIQSNIIQSHCQMSCRAMKDDQSVHSPYLQFLGVLTKVTTIDSRFPLCPQMSHIPVVPLYNLSFHPTNLMFLLPSTPVPRPLS